MKLDVKNTMQIHSKAKVDFYKTYLERYVAYSMSIAIHKTH